MFREKNFLKVPFEGYITQNLNDQYDEALRMIDKEIDEHEEMIRELEKQEEDENDEEREDRDSE